MRLLRMSDDIEETVKESLNGSAYIDGANDLIVLFGIPVPMIHTMAVIPLYYGVGHWNGWLTRRSLSKTI